MAATEVEDLAALVGIEILPDNSCEDVNVACNSHEIQPQTEVETKPDHDDDDDDTKDCELTKASWAADEEGVDAKLCALEEEFSHRYTSLDTDFMHTLTTPVRPPPCLAPWWSNDRGNDRSRGGRGWGRGHNRGRGHYHDNQQHHRDRWDSSQGRGGYQGHRESGHRYHDDRRDSYRDRPPHGHRDRSPVRRDRY
ncbi:hypothetical protein ACOMHN_040212 [Nucella lapillus]